MLRCLVDNKRALRGYAANKDGLPKNTKRRKKLIKLRDLLLTDSFWDQVEDILSILEPISELQKASESNHASITYVYPRWMKIKEHLQQIAGSAANLFAKAISGYLINTNPKGRTWKIRIKKQLLSLHTLAYFLTPLNRLKPMNSTIQDQVNKILKHYAKPGQERALIQEFSDYRMQRGEFRASGGNWEYADDPLLYWMQQVSV
jgi:hypothetical protein